MKKTFTKKKKFLLIIDFLLIVFIIISLIYIINSLIQKKAAIEESNLLNEINIGKSLSNSSENTYNQENFANEQNVENPELKENQLNIESNENQSNLGSSNNISSSKNFAEASKTERMIKVENLKKQNSDIVGWLEIPNTNINYPVLQGTDNKYYMTHNYKKQKSKNGSIFLTKDYNWDIPSSNLLIFGHNLNNGTMFQDLLKYSNKSFYEKHPTIRFTTVNDDSEYEIISVLKTRVFYQSEKNVFRYYYFINAETEEEYNEFIKNAKKESLYNINATANYGEQLITLSTCSYHVKDGRFAVIARKK